MTDESTTASSPVHEPQNTRATRRRGVDEGAYDRQVLVTGGGLAPLAAAAFLDRAGLDPVLAVETADPSHSTMVTLCPSGLELLERLGLRHPAEAHGRAVRALHRCPPSQLWHPSSSRFPAIVARREYLDGLFGRYLAGRVRTVTQPLVSIETSASSVRVTFEHGVTERFDALVTTDTAQFVPAPERRRASPVHYWEFEWPATVSPPDVPTDGWAPGAGGYTMHDGDTVRVGLLCDSTRTIESPLSLTRLRTRFGTLFGRLNTALASLDEGSISYTQIRHVTPASPSAGASVLVGPRAHASIPGDGLGPTLALEDAWVVADALAHEPSSVRDALSTYDERRQQRLSALHALVHAEPFAEEANVAGTGVARAVCARRSLAFDYLFDVSADGVWRVGSEAL